MHERHGIEAVTIANPLYIKEVRKRFPDIEICASVMSDIDSVERALIFSRAGADVITPDVSINRNLKLLRDIKKNAAVELKLLVNEGCLYRYPFRRFHFNYISHHSKELGKYKGESAFIFDCLDEYRLDPSQILRSCWIRPEDIGRYGDITKYFKIVGRAGHKNIGVAILKYIKAYMNESWNGNLLEIVNASINKYSRKEKLFLDNKALTRCGFFDRVTSCGYDCLQCNYCKDLAARLISPG